MVYRSSGGLKNRAHEVRQATRHLRIMDVSGLAVTSGDARGIREEAPDRVRRSGVRTARDGLGVSGRFDRREPLTDGAIAARSRSARERRAGARRLETSLCVERPAHMGSGNKE